MWTGHCHMGIYTFSDASGFFQHVNKTFNMQMNWCHMWTRCVHMLLTFFDMYIKMFTCGNKTWHHIYTHFTCVFIIFTCQLRYHMWNQCFFLHVIDLWNVHFLMWIKCLYVRYIFFTCENNLWEKEHLSVSRVWICSVSSYSV